MASKSESERKTIRESGSPLARHSLNQRKLGYERAGGIKVFGKEAEKSGAKVRRDASKEERRQALYDSAVRIFNGVINEKDLLTILFHIDEFEQDAGMPNATIVDFKGLKPTDSFFGEPEFFRKK